MSFAVPTALRTSSPSPFFLPYSLISLSQQQNIETLIISRFIGGFFGSAVFNSVALIPDLFLVDDPWNGWALNIWALSAESIVIGQFLRASSFVFMGESSWMFVLTAPIFGAYIVRDLGWRWVFVSTCSAFASLHAEENYCVDSGSR